MKRTLGISRNKLQQFISSKKAPQKRQSRFKLKPQQQVKLIQSKFKSNTENPIKDSQPSTSRNSSTDNSEIENLRSFEIYEEAKICLQSVIEIRKKITTETKARISSFKEQDTQRIDANICKFCAQAVEQLRKAQKTHSYIRNIKGQTITEQKYYRNMEISLAMEIKQCSRQLRTQQKEYYDKIRIYEGGTTNNEIKLTNTQRDKMKDQFEDSDVVFSLQQTQFQDRNKNIQQLVENINILTQLYKHLNQLTIQQGSIVDRIDENIDGTLLSAQKANKALQKANKHARTTCSEKCMIILLVLIMILAILIALKPRWVKYLQLAAIA